MLCLVYNTTGEPLELVPSLMGLVLHVRGKAVILEIFPGRFLRSPRLEFPAPRSVVLRKHRRVRSVQNARAEIRHHRNHRARVREEQNAPAPIAPVSDPRAQEQAVQTSQTPSFLQSFGLR